MTTPRQEVVFVEKWKSLDHGLAKALPIALPSGEPKRVWTLFPFVSKDSPPSLPFRPIHGNNAFLEDRIHDWVFRQGQLHYHSRVADRPVWLLLEY